jgi:type IV secretory pathway ATPase VirB11/archaellum biosynthesis ATPase
MLLDRLRGDGGERCGCNSNFEGGVLVLDAAGCAEGDLREPGCRATAVATLRERDAERVVVRTPGTDRRYGERATALLVAAGRFAARVAGRDPGLATRAERDPLGAAHEAGGRAGAVADAAAEAGLLVAAEGLSYDEFRPTVAPEIARSQVVPDPPPAGELADERTLPTDAVARVYEVPGEELRCYHLTPAEAAFDDGARRALRDAHELLVAGAVEGGRAPRRAARRAVAGDAVEAEQVAAVLRKHTRGYGVLEDLFADDRVSDVFAAAPAGRAGVRVRAGGETLRTNVRLTEDGAAALASRLRRESGRAFSRADPTIDATAATESGRVRAAGVGAPASDGPGFAFRDSDGEQWTLPGLVENDTLSARAAALLSLSVERGAAVLVAGPRGAGKTTLLGALLWELPAADRLVVIEDTPELPVAPLQSAGRDVQPIRVDRDGTGLSPATALRTALRLGEGALAVGEVRGEEAAALYEAMRVGASASAVLGTVHGDGACAVRDRVVDDLGVSRRAFGATDLVVTLALRETDEGRRREVAAVAEVGDAGDGFESLFARDGETLAPTGPIARGNSRLLTVLAGPGESYADLRGALDDRETFLADLARTGQADPDAVVEAHAVRRS